MSERTQYKISRWEAVFGGDLWFLRTLSRRLFNVFVGLVPIKRWRKNIRDYFDQILIRRYKNKINYFIEHYPAVRSESETIKLIVDNHYSIARFGDGEFNMCIGRNKSFQRYDETLVARLKAILASQQQGLLIGINTIHSAKDLSTIWKKFVIRRGNRVLGLLDSNRVYDSSTITTNFPQDKDAFESHVAQLKKIWQGRKVVFVIGRNSRFFFEEELFHNIAEYDFVCGPAKNAFQQYDELLEQVTTYDKDWLIVISLGPTATVMAYDLHLMGYQAIDLGQTPSKYHLAKYGTKFPKDHPLSL